MHLNISALVLLPLSMSMVCTSALLRLRMRHSDWRTNGIVDSNYLIIDQSTIVRDLNK